MSGGGRRQARPCGLDGGILPPTPPPDMCNPLGRFCFLRKNYRDLRFVTTPCRERLRQDAEAEPTRTCLPAYPGKG